MATIDNFYVLAAVFALAIALICTSIIWDGLAQNEIFGHNAVTLQIEQRVDNLDANLDTIFVIAFFAAHLSVIVLVFFLRSHPVVYVAGFFLTIILAIISAPLSNAFATFTADPGISGAAAQYSMMTAIMANLPAISVVMAIITLVVLAGLARTEGVL